MTKQTEGTDPENRPVVNWVNEGKTPREVRLEGALKRIAKWNGEFPETGRYWNDSSEEQMSYSAAFGSNGERDYMRVLAQEALDS